MMSRLASAAWRLAPVLLFAACISARSEIEPPGVAHTQYDLVIIGRWVLDPESGLDAVRNIGISGGVVQAVTEAPMDGIQHIDASGLVVAPGFIDLHQHTFTPDILRAKVLDGVTAALEMESGVADVDAWYPGLEGQAPIHFGTAASHAAARTGVIGGSTSEVPSGDAAHRCNCPGSAKCRY
jgi:hypothetical protein